MLEKVTSVETSDGCRGLGVGAGSSDAPLLYVGIIPPYKLTFCLPSSMTCSFYYQIEAMQQKKRKEAVSVHSNLGAFPNDNAFPS